MSLPTCEEVIQDLMAAHQINVVKSDGSVEYMYSVVDVKGMLLEMESRGYGRAEREIYNNVCNICNGDGKIDAWNSYTRKKEDWRMCCWKCIGSGKLETAIGYEYKRKS